MSVITSSQKTTSGKKNAGRFVIIGISVFVLILIIADLFLRRAERKKQSVDISPTTTPNKYSIKDPQEKSFIMNRLNTLDEVNGYSWANDKLIYSNSQGIYEAGTNTPIIERVISYIDFDPSGNAVLKSDNVWFIFNSSNNSLSQINIEATNPSINLSTNMVGYIYDKKLILADFKNNRNVQTDNNDNINNFFWAYETGLIATEQDSGNKKNIVVYNTNLESKYNFEISKEASLLNISHDGLKVALVENNKLSIRKVSSAKEEANISFNQGLSFSGNWISNYEMIIIETTPPDSLGRIVNYIWKVDSTGNKTFLETSQPIPRKLNTNTKFIPNFSHNLLPLVENQGKLWLLSLVRGVQPNYSPSGEYFIDTPDIPYQEYGF